MEINKQLSKEVVHEVHKVRTGEVNSLATEEENVKNVWNTIQ